jgi:RNA polymerase sigma-70 factor (ECF subfamily)
MDMASTWAEAEFETIFREHFARMVGVIRRVLRSDAEAEEICAEAFLKLYRMGPGDVAEGTAGAWLYRVATRSAIDSLRRHKRRGFEEQLDAGRTDISDSPGSDPLVRLVREERIAEVRLALARLKAEKAQVLLLRHSGLSYQEIAAAMRIKPASVGTMLARAEAEFSMLYQRQQRLGKHAPRLQAANHPSDEDLSLGTPANHPSDEDLSLGTPVKEGR